VTQRIREFMDLYPDIRIDMILSDDLLDLAMREADVAIWTREPEQSDLIRRSLGTMRVRAFASTSYVRRTGAPQSIEDIDKHRLVSYGGTPAAYLSALRWLETAGRDGREPRHPAFRTNSVVAMKYAIRAGVGIGLLPEYMTEEGSDLVPVLNDVELPTMPVLFVYPEELKTSKKVQVLRDFLVSKARTFK
jgi:DNA-binding transcriptional LysR family regulator